MELVSGLGSGSGPVVLCAGRSGVGAVTGVAGKGSQLTPGCRCTRGTVAVCALALSRRRQVPGAGFVVQGLEYDVRRTAQVVRGGGIVFEPAREGLVDGLHVAVGAYEGAYRGAADADRVLLVAVGLGGGNRAVGGVVRRADGVGEAAVGA